MSTEPRKVCMLVYQDYFMDARVQQYVEVLVAEGFRVDVLCSRLLNPPPENLAQEIKVYPIPITHGQGGMGKILLEYLAAFVCFSFRLLFLFFSRRYSVIHIHNMPDFLVFTAIIPKILGARVILDIHDPMPEFYLSKFAGRYALLARFVQMEERLSTRFADRIITANPIFMENIIRRGVDPQKIQVVANYPDPQVFVRDRYPRKEHAIDQEYRLIYPGTLAARYGLDVPIRALVRLAEHIPQIRLVIIGPHSPYVVELKKLAQELDVDRWLEIRPAMPIGQVPEEMAQADVGIYTARPDPHMDIAISGKIIEYAIMGIPVVTSQLTIVEKLFPPDAVAFFPPGNVDAFSDRILDLYQNPRVGRDLVKKMDEVMEKNHSWEKEQDQYMKLINTLVMKEK